MAKQNSDIPGDIIAPLYLAFDKGRFYGLEYVLDELVGEKSAPADQDSVDWFGATDYFA